MSLSLTPWSPQAFSASISECFQKIQEAFSTFSSCEDGFSCTFSLSLVLSLHHPGRKEGWRNTHTFHRKFGFFVFLTKYSTCVLHEVKIKSCFGFQSLLSNWEGLVIYFILSWFRIATLFMLWLDPFKWKCIRAKNINYISFFIRESDFRYYHYNGFCKRRQRHNSCWFCVSEMLSTLEVGSFLVIFGRGNDRRAYRLDTIIAELITGDHNRDHWIVK